MNQAHFTCLNCGKSLDPGIEFCSIACEDAYDSWDGDDVWEDEIMADWEEDSLHDG